MHVVDSVLLYPHQGQKDGMGHHQDSVVDFIRKVMEGRDNVRVREEMLALLSFALAHVSVRIELDS